MSAGCEAHPWREFDPPAVTAVDSVKVKATRAERVLRRIIKSLLVDGMSRKDIAAIFDTTLRLEALVAFQAGLRPRPWSPEALAMARWDLLKELNTILLVPGVAAGAGAAVLVRRWVASTVPRVERRQATLERRTLDDVVPNWAQVTVYAS
jgi:hypothetical protein